VYTVLPPGDFTFEVRCENEDGLSSPSTSYSFHINPPFWQTWWFVMLVAAAIAAILYLFHRSRMNRLVALAELRNRVARDLHDDVGSTLSTISILSTIAKSKLTDNPSQAEQYITKITDNSQQMMDAMDDIVWSIKPMNDSMQKIVARMREFASGVLEPKNIDVEFIVDERVLNIRLNMESRRDLFLVFKEAINNIAKYSGAQRVVVHVSYIRNRLMLKIKDDGTGFEVDIADSGNGLNNMKKRAAMMQGRIKIASQKNKGTLVLLNIPVNA
jgi:signal transduction histidine kinase